MANEFSRERKLAVILHADIVGSTALVHRDETIAHVRITDAFSRFSKRVVAYAGTVREIRGDALVAEFARASDALSCALAAQETNAAHNATLSDDIRPQMRVGIALGEVVIADATVTGPGIVLAQRLEQLAEPGGVCVQGSVYEAAPRRMPFVYTNLGEREVKGFDETVRAFAVALKPGETAPPPDPPSLASNTTAPARHRWVTRAMVALILIAAGLIAWFQPWKSEFRPKETRNVVAAPMDKPSIAILPFDNLSDDKGQDYFADGMTEDIITDLSKISGLFVIARNSSFVYKGKSVDIIKVGRELGVKFVLEGSIRRAGDEIRVNAQLIDAQTGGHLWAERIDGQTADVFKLQDQVTQRIVDALKVKMTSDEQQRLENSGKVNPQAYDLYLQGKQLQATQQHSAQMLKLYGHAVKLDPNFAEAHARLANVAYDVARTDKFWILPQKEALALIESHAAKALALEPANAMALATLAHQALEAGQTDDAIKMIERAVSAAPGDVDVLARQTYVLSRVGRYDDAAATAELVLRLEPNPTAAQLMLLSNVYLHARQYEKSVKYGEMAKEMGIRPVWALETLVAGYARLKMQTKLDHAKTELLALWPDVCLRYWRHLFDYFRPPTTLEHWLESQRLAGIPEWPQGLVPSPENMLTKKELAAVFDPDVQRVGQQVRADGTGWRWRSASNPDGGDTSIWQSSKGQRFVFSGTKPRLVMAKDGRQVRERCTRDPDHDMGRERCYLILHNPGGSKATRDEYLFASYRSLSKFAVFPRDEEIDWTKPSK